MPSPRELPFRAGPFECYHFLGGHQTEVYLARDSRTGFTRAVKILPAGFGLEAEAMRRFVEEGEVACRCSHPNLVVTYEAKLADGLAYIAMEHLQGETLKKKLERGGLGSVKERVEIAVQIARGLGYLHSQRLIHGDVRPENVTIDPLGGVKVYDFGFQSLRGNEGAPLYLSPEQVRGEGVTAASDIYSYGVLLFVLFSGAFPYRALNREDMYAAIVFYAPDMRPLEGKGIPEAVMGSITDCLQKEPGARPRSFREIETRLKEAAAPAGAGPAPAVAPKRSSSPIVGWLMGLAAFLLVGAGLWWYQPWRMLQTRTEAVAETTIAAKGGAMVLVPAGQALIGRDRQAAQVPAFYIDRTEVANEAYREFCRETLHVLPDGEAAEVPASFPVINVSYDDAAAFCNWAGKRLPSALEWEKAARGPSGRAYPWGEDLRFDLVNIPYGNEPHELQPVESNFSGASQYGAINLLGNVWEWVAQPEKLESGDLREVVLNPPLEAGERAFQIRGGSYLQKVDLKQAVWDYAVAPARLKRADIGFRCVK